LSIDELRRHPEYRGQRYVDLGAAIAVDGWLTPRVIGDAVALGVYSRSARLRIRQRRWLPCTGLGLEVPFLRSRSGQPAPCGLPRRATSLSPTAGAH
jgi:hypothetical protein